MIFKRSYYNVFVMKLVVCECDHMHMRSVNMQDVVLCCVVLCQVKLNVITD